MRILYIGQYTEGTTSKMRAETLKHILQPEEFEGIDTHIPFFKCHPFWRSLAFRFKRGKVIWDTNKFILKKLSGTYDAIWVDKAIFITKEVTRQLKSNTKLLIHYTPDAAFEENRSQYFYESLPLYDYVITTKSFETEAYLKFIKPEQLIFVPQGYNKQLHSPKYKFEEKLQRVVFIGLYEASRGEIIKTLLNNKIPVAIAGKNWQLFVAKHQDKALTFLGEGLFSEAYVEAISASAFGLGLVSKRFPELHTTRTFEIPACGTALLTEYNQEIADFYNDDEVIFFKDADTLVSKIKFYLENPDALQRITENGLKKVRTGGYDYQEQLTGICKQTGIFNVNKRTS